jgi:glycine dehydrogenase
LITRAEPVGIEIVIGNHETVVLDETYFGAIIQYPASNGEVYDYTNFMASAKQHNVLVTVAADILSLTLLTPPGEWGADVVVGTSQRFGVPMGYGGPHAGFFATKDAYKRQMPGRLIGVSIDSQGNPALRMALQTREQHIKREKATSNICTAQVLLSIMASMYGVYHGPQGLKGIASRVHGLTNALANELNANGLLVSNKNYFDTLTVKVSNANDVLKKCVDAKININKINESDYVYHYKRTKVSCLQLQFQIISLFSYQRNCNNIARD